MAGENKVDRRTFQVARSSLRPVAEDLGGSDFVRECQAAPDGALLGQGPRLPLLGPTLLPSSGVRPEVWG
jgi:hypothetical protein